MATTHVRQQRGNNSRETTGCRARLLSTVRPPLCRNLRATAGRQSCCQDKRSLGSEDDRSLCPSVAIRQQQQQHTATATATLFFANRYGHISTRQTK